MPPAASATTSAAKRSTRRLVRVTGGVSVTQGWRLSSRNPLGGKQLVNRLAATHQAGRAGAHQDFGRAQPRVVIGAHRHAVGAGREDGEELAFARRQVPVLGEEIS